jgi:hypothetical protein
MNEMGGACSSYEEERVVQRGLVGNMRERDHWKNSGLDGRIILRRIFRMCDVGYGLD